MRNQKMASVSELRILFGNVEEMYEENKKLLAEMEELIATKNAGVGQLFLKYVCISYYYQANQTNFVL